MDALLLVDLQNDFLPGGALAVPGGDRVLPVANAVQSAFPLVVATQDWHPANHGSFAANHPGRRVGETIDLDGLPQILWPAHCVQDSAGADFAPGLNRDRIRHVVRKGTDPRLDSYSGFFDNGHRQSTGLDEYLRGHGVTRIFVLGLATDYCVKSTAVDGRRLGFDVTLIADGCRAVNIRPHDGEDAIAAMRNAGVRIVASEVLGSA